MKTLRDYSGYVEHPRFGRGPRFTGLYPDPEKERICTTWWMIFEEEADAEEFQSNSIGELKGDYGIAIPGTAIRADLSAQTPMTMQFTHYYDMDRKCTDCGRRFIFFAEEQKFWYEDLQFYGGVNCHHCITCRKKRQNISLMSSRYEKLFHLRDRTDAQTMEMIGCGIKLVEAGAFGKLCLNRLRHAVKDLSPAFSVSEEALDIKRRLQVCGETG